MRVRNVAGTLPAAVTGDGAGKALRNYPLRHLVATGVIAVSAGISGCASIAEGVTRGLTQGGKDAQPLPCEVTGPAFEGVEARLSRYESMFTAGRQGRSDIKVLMIHGIGTHPPGWAGRLRHNLTAALDLTVRERAPKRIILSSPIYPGKPIGELNVLRHFNEARTRKMLTYELSWSEITTPKKEWLAFDISGDARRNRATLNNTVKGFLNDRLADPMAYLGEAGTRILESVAQANCWMASGDWEELPDGVPVVCDFANDTNFEDLRDDDFVLITHSLGSRIATDSFQRRDTSIDRMLETDIDPDDRQKLKALREELKSKRIRVYMLANQLPLLDIASEAPAVTGEFDAYCRPGGSHYDKRRFQELFIVAFSDPNDLLSFALPPSYAEEHIDSRVCPRAVNVSVNVTQTINLFNVGEFANPLKAHELYDNDPRVIGIIAGGVGNERTRPIVREECTWTRTLDD